MALDKDKRALLQVERGWPVENLLSANVGRAETIRESLAQIAREEPETMLGDAVIAAEKLRHMIEEQLKVLIEKETESDIG